MQYIEIENIKDYKNKLYNVIIKGKKEIFKTVNYSKLNQLIENQFYYNFSLKIISCN